MKLLPLLRLTVEDEQIWLLVTYRFCMRNVVLKSPIAGFEPGVDRRDAELMLGLTGFPCGSQGICVACLFEIGCVVNNGSGGTRIAKRGYESEYGEPRSDITYFA